MYDPIIGRVLSPDIAVQSPGYTQSYNRYSYCMNNPMKYTDPSGWYVEEGYTTTDINEITTLLNYVSSGGTLSSFGFNNWSATTVSNENSWGIIIDGSESFRNDVKSALNKIDNTYLGHIVLRTISINSTVNPLTINSALFTDTYDYITSTINFAGRVVLGRALGAQNYFDTNLGHELWHAFQNRILGKEYSVMEKSIEGIRSLEKGAIAFENYLASVFYNEDYVRTNYNRLGQLWNKGMDYFNKQNESLRIINVPDRQGNPMYFNNWQNNLAITPSLITYYNNLANIWVNPN